MRHFGVRRDADRSEGDDEAREDEDNEDDAKEYENEKDAAPTSTSSSVELVSLLDVPGEDASSTKCGDPGPQGLLSSRGRGAVSTVTVPSMPRRILATTLTAFAIAVAISAVLFTINPAIQDPSKVNETAAYQHFQGFDLTSQQIEQVNSFRSGRGMILHLHVTHHAGTTFCHTLGASSAAMAAAATAAAGRESTFYNNASSARLAKGAPPFACRIDRKTDTLNANLTSNPRFVSRVPWMRNETQSMIELLRPYYHMVSFEFGFKLPTIRLQNTDWDNVHLVSVFLTRHPLERMLAGDAYVNEHYQISNPNASRQDWWDFANMTAHGYTDNLMLRVLSNDPECCQGADTPRQRLEEAVDLLSRFTFVLDVNCLNEGMVALATILGLDDVVNESMKRTQRLHHVHPANIAARYPYRDVYDYLVIKNQLDLELYRWTQMRALVQCPM